MKITLHRDNIGQTASGQWVERRSGEWVAIDPPAWSVKPTPEDPHAMADPYKRNGEAVTLVTVQRVLTRTVPDYEAEVLLRNGWELMP